MRQASLTFLVLVLSIAGPPVPLAQTADTLALSVLLEAPRTDTTRMWVGIKNTSDTALTLCRRLWNYTWISSDPAGYAGGESKSSIHGCGDDDHDPLWLLLPGETRFDSYVVKGSADDEAALMVDVEVLQHNVGAGPPVAKVLSGRAKPRTLSLRMSACASGNSEPACGPDNP
jgi:hypothetical protein